MSLRRKTSRKISVVVLKRVSADDREQAAFEEAVRETGHWEKCRSCNNIYYSVAGYVDHCENCGQRRDNPPAG